MCLCNPSLSAEEKDLGAIGWGVQTVPTTSTTYEEWDSDTEETTPNPPNPSLPTEEKDLGGIGWEVVRSTTPVSPEEWDCDEILENSN